MVSTIETKFDTNPRIESCLKHDSRVLHVRDFFKHLPTALISEPGPVYIQAMTLEADHAVLPTINALIRRASEGRETHVTVDGYIEGVTGDVSNYLLPFIRDGGWRNHLSIQNRIALEQLKNAGVLLERTNMPRSDLEKFLARGFFRDHRKQYRIGDRVFVGGPNLSAGIFNRLDFVIELTDVDILEELTDQFFEINEHSVKENKFVELGDTEILTDAGNGSSIIQEDAIKLIDSANSKIDLMTTFLPPGEIGRHLNKASDRGVEVRVFTSDYGFLHSKFCQFDPSRINIRYPSEGLAHAKLLIVDEQAMFGSHNFNPISVATRTKDTSIKTTRRWIVNPLQVFFNNAFEGNYSQSSI